MDGFKNDKRPTESVQEVEVRTNAHETMTARKTEDEKVKAMEEFFGPDWLERVR